MGMRVRIITGVQMLILRERSEFLALSPGLWVLEKGTERKDCLGRCHS
jgi:hypothetical protein